MNDTQTIAAISLCVSLFSLSIQEGYADIVNVEPDLFSDGTDISNPFAGVTLSATGGSIPSPDSQE